MSQNAVIPVWVSKVPTFLLTSVGWSLICRQKDDVGNFLKC